MSRVTLSNTGTNNEKHTKKKKKKKKKKSEHECLGRVPLVTV